MVKLSFDKGAPNCANPDGMHNQEVGYPTVENMNPRSYGKMECPEHHAYVFAPSSQFPKKSINPERHKYASESELKSMKLVK